MLRLNSTFGPKTYFILIILTGISALLTTSPVQAAGLNLYVQPISSAAETQRAYKPLADYLSKKTGKTITVKTESNFLTYWERMRRGKGFDLVLDAAHFTDYRDQKLGYQVLAKIPYTVNFSLVTSGNLLLFGASELIGKTLASAPSPSLAGVRIAQIYPNPLRQPNIVPANTFQDALNMLHAGKIQAALVPTSMVSGDNSVNTVMTTAPVPHMAISASPKVDEKTKAIIRKALLDASKDKLGKIVLQKLHIASFQPATNAMYKGYANLLDGVWGYSD